MRFESKESTPNSGFFGFNFNPHSDSPFLYPFHRAHAQCSLGIDHGVQRIELHRYVLCCCLSLFSKMSSNPCEIQQHLESRRGRSEELFFDPTTGKLKVMPRRDLEFTTAMFSFICCCRKTRRIAPGSTGDRPVMVDLYKIESGGFFTKRWRSNSIIISQLWI